MAEQPQIDVQVGLEGTTEVATGIGQVMQETTTTVKEAIQGLMAEQQNQLNELLAQVQIEGSEVWQKRQDEIKKTKGELDALRRSQQEVTASIKDSGAAYGEAVGRIAGTADFSFSKMMGKIPGATIMQGGLLALFLHGYAETGRLEAEARILTQIFEASSNQVVGSTRPVIDAFKALEVASMTTKAEMLSIMGAFAAKGQPFAVLKEDLGDVTKNIVSASRAFDAMLERPSGTSAKDFMTLMGRYNMSGQQLILTYNEMAMSAQASRIGTERFMTAIFDASRTLKSYGVDVMQLTGLFATLNRRLEEMGVPVEARLAGLGGIAQGLANIPRQWRAMIGMDIMRNTPGQQGPITPMAGIMAYETGGMKGESDFLMQTLTSMQAFLRQMVSNVPANEQAAAMYNFMRTKMGMSQEAAAILRDLFMGNEDFRKMGLTPAAIKELQNAMKDEATKQTEFAQASAKIMGALQQLAIGVFEVLTTTLSVIVGGVTYMIGWAEGPVAGKEMRAETVKVLGEVMEGYGKSLGRFTKAFKLMGEAGKTLGGGLGAAEDYLSIYQRQAERSRSDETSAFQGYPGMPGSGIGGLKFLVPRSIQERLGEYFLGDMMRRQEREHDPERELRLRNEERERRKKWGGIEVEGAMNIDGKQLTISVPLEVIEEVANAYNYNNSQPVEAT